jgi:hypothetical protein
MNENEGIIRRKRKKPIERACGKRLEWLCGIPC